MAGAWGPRSCSAAHGTCPEGALEGTQMLLWPGTRCAAVTTAHPGHKQGDFSRRQRVVFMAQLCQAAVHCAKCSCGFT